jgi:hypothetical protein
MMETGIGARWAPELIVGKDPVSGATVRQYTSYRAHSNHSYFTYPCWCCRSRPGHEGAGSVGGEVGQRRA